ncbi:MAG: hypothetical protein M1300_08845 [Epsilonproteobacteria bacterium]|nr:hypothetical protein [Campylobacterota bacterium]
MAVNILLDDYVVEQLLKNKFCKVVDEKGVALYVAPQKAYHRNEEADYRYSLLMNGSLDGRGFNDEASLREYMSEIGDEPILLYVAKIQNIVPLENISSFVTIKNHEKLTIDEIKQAEADGKMILFKAHRDADYKSLSDFGLTSVESVLREYPHLGADRFKVGDENFGLKEAVESINALNKVSTPRMV